MRILRRGPSRRPRRGGFGSVLFRLLPRESFLRRVWAGTKLTALAALTLAVLLDPEWGQVGAVAAVSALAIAAARVPLGAIPRLPIWLVISLGLGLLLAAVGNGTMQYLNVMALSTLFTVLSAIVVWTTSTNDIAPALRRLGRPFARLGAPVDEWADATALCVRALPLLVDEMRTLAAARRLRGVPGAWRGAQLSVTAVDLLTTSMAAAMRRSGDMGEAMTARGGIGAPTAESAQLSWRDAVVIAVTGLACVLPHISL
jgi:energy-coupling factor transport system permease protein